MLISGVTLNGVYVVDLPSIITTGALMYVDAGKSLSYPGTGTTWTDLSLNTNNATLVGSPPFTSSGLASYLSFNGTGSQYASTVASKFNTTYTGKTIFFAARITAFSVGIFRCLFGTNGGSRNFNTYIYTALVQVFIKCIIVLVAAGDLVTTYRLQLINGLLVLLRRPLAD
jgi:hypothetical protein